MSIGYCATDAAVSRFNGPLVIILNVNVYFNFAIKFIIAIRAPCPMMENRINGIDYNK